jgi:tetrapyrrole methylase family protein / MazG family protein
VRGLRELCDNLFLFASTMASGKRPPKKSKSPKRKRSASPGRAFEELVAVMARLRAPDGCPWDREQSHATLRTYLIEEAYEVLDALDSGDDAKFSDELGDLLLQVLFHAQIAAEEKRFAIQDVIRAIHGKMIRRHPHVFGKTRARTSDEVLRNWELLKKEERAASANATETKKADSILDGVPRALPALMEAFQITRKAARVGFDWDSAEGIFAKLEVEASELRTALRTEESAANIELEMGDILFAAVNLARFLRIDPELALKKSSQKFSRRFREMERLAREQGAAFADVPRAQMESLWEKSKLADPGSK